ncbi:MAG: hypothetical protein OSB62_05325 [Alphaproteobacteria bacterium]|jgi:hypothetical protein|nr:hypothetical protein [Alphaproteobacteria bacterium]
MERYVVFIRNNKTGEEFVTTTMQMKGAHSLAVSSVQNKYPNPRYTVHTAYTTHELSKVIDHVANFSSSRMTPKQPVATPSLRTA